MFLAFLQANKSRKPVTWDYSAVQYLFKEVWPSIQNSLTAITVMHQEENHECKHSLNNPAHRKSNDVHSCGQLLTAQRDFVAVVFPPIYVEICS